MLVLKGLTPTTVSTLFGKYFVSLKEGWKKLDVLKGILKIRLIAKPRGYKHSMSKVAVL